MTSRKLVIAVLAIGSITAWYLFRPERLFINRTVAEPPPAMDSMAVALLSGGFHTGAHPTAGRATIYRLAGGERILRLTGFTTSNGPDVRVYLVAAGDVRDNATPKRVGFIDLGALKGNVGDQNYLVPADIDLTQFRSVSVWCRRFSVNFGAAPLA